PEHPRTGDRIDIPRQPDDVLVFHAGTIREVDGSLITSGGRVLAVTGLGESIEVAQQRSQSSAASVSFADKQFRTDIGWRELTRSSLRCAARGRGDVPELPETETIARDLDRAITGTRIVDARVVRADVLREVRAAAFVRRVRDTAIVRCWRRAKLIVLDLSSG